MAGDERSEDPAVKRQIRVALERICEESAETLTGWKTFEAYGRTVPEVFSIVDPVSHKPAPDPVEICLRPRPVG